MRTHAAAEAVQAQGCAALAAIAARVLLLRQSAAPGPAESQGF